jgi:hypothetical protein
MSLAAAQLKCSSAAGGRACGERPVLPLPLILLSSSMLLLLHLLQ